ncbi:hypothetical protein SAMD00019534_089680 [Acytostelium subglobosum LB1]|uniref:hypothetical protein n=1 Tax=Acytostelium subglobosum LB1 TaxID=1410327 RepID=UPI0006447ACF|nr:hypothetical protein SAMD00019534_089680 [Acytostelium subglobosum LB1]GAM25793.1 hypothetical protein SAMD00019534_089680 [Acytostelium subglobosum LB1]|eukprot:XP_012751311.1 hypothetical protein SAMD00019534_089680 [Acytostelium subglobosum LB1]
MQTGESGKKYGLQIPASKLKSAFGNSFEEDDDDDDDTNSKSKTSTKSTTTVKNEGAIDYYRQRELENAKKNRPTSSVPTTKVEKMQVEALELDPTAFEYDSVYDSMKQEKKKGADAMRAGLQQQAQKPKYINDLLQHADRKKKELEKVKDHQVQRERDAEGDTFKDKDVFITSAYKKQLEERKREEERERLLEQEEDVTKKKDMSSFHKNMYHSITDDKPEAQAQTKDSNKSSSSSSSYSRPRDDDRGGSGRGRGGGGDGGGGRRYEDRDDHGYKRRDRDGDRYKDRGDNNESSYSSSSSSSRHSKKESSSASKTVDNTPKLLYPRRNDEQSIAAARERYLQRKLNRA